MWYIEILYIENYQACINSYRLFELHNGGVHLSIKQLFNDGWEFCKQSLGTTLEEINRNEVLFEPVDIPHDWLIYNSQNLYEDSVGWYRKRFVINNLCDEKLLLRFEGVYMNSKVYVNDKKVGEWKYGYSSFEFDITEYVFMGDNEIKVQVIHQSPNSRWYSGAGIYRDVWIKKVKDTRIESDGIYITTHKEQDQWSVEVQTQVIGHQQATLKHTIMYGNQSLLTSQMTINQGVDINKQVLYVNEPKLWDTESPNLYTLKSELLLDDIVLEVERTTFGFRTIEFNAEKGFILNGNSVKLYGVCEHHDLGCLGCAFNKAAMRRRFEILKKMGVNAVRTSHNMPAVGVMELADEMGLLIVSESFDMWQRPKTQYDYARFFNEWAACDVASWIRRDRNHPSVIMWSIGNEIYDTHVDERGQDITRLLMSYVLEHDPNGNAVVTIGSNYMPWENAQKCADIVKIVGYNYAHKYYDAHHNMHPDWVIYGSETSSTVQSRGIYHFPYEKSLLADDDEQCSALGNSTTSWGAKSSEACIIAHRDAEYSMGQFIWTGFDYIGEPTPYHTKNSYFGQIDTAGFEKDSYYIYQSEWTDYKKSPMIHILPYWDFNEGQLIDVRVCSNAPRMELQFNAKTIGTYDVDHKNGQQLLGWWKIPYTSGELRAIAYDEMGKVIAIDVRKSFKDAKRIVLTPNKYELQADGQDLIFIEISMRDEDGNNVENANNRVEVNVQGAGRLIGLDNGDSTDYDSYKGTSRRLFSGKLLAVIAAKLLPGDIEITVSSLGLETQTLKFNAIASKHTNGKSDIIENKALPVVMGNALHDIPVRKIELVSLSGKQLSQELRQLKVQATIYPQNSSYTQLEWCVVNDSGIPSDIAAISANESEAIVTALGDGSFRLRCMSKNGTDKIKVISQLEFTVTGIGRMYKDPYGFISAGVYDYSKGEVGNGNERGVATSRDGETQVGYKGIDFGEYGSDEITIGIFALSSEQYRIQIWEGIPGEPESSVVADAVYQKPSIWNVYQQETFKLSKRLKGITTLCFVLHAKIHIKGFSFNKLNKAFEQLSVKACNHLYGDTYTITEEGIEGIGNNVTIEFENMDFGANGFNKLIVCGRTGLDKNTIQVRFSGDCGEINQAVEFSFSKQYVEREFYLENVCGMNKVSFVFLPGCQFDFKWFQFKH